MNAYDPDGSKWAHAVRCSYQALEDEKTAMSDYGASLLESERQQNFARARLNEVRHRILSWQNFFRNYSEAS